MNFEKLCYEIAHTKPTEIKRLVEIAKGQSDYLHPLKSATQAKQNALGKHNLKVINQFLKLKAILNEEI